MSSSTVDEPLAGPAAAVPLPAGPLPPAPRPPGAGWPRLMHNSIRTYDWGSRHVLATLQGRAVPGGPEAELWMGAHPGAPSLLAGPGADGVPLPELVARDPEAVLGAACHAAFGPRLPFLLKVLAVEKALSVQVHPSPAQAAAGHAREDAAGVPAGSAGRVYTDPHAKPELLVAVTPFEALAGLRPAARAAELLGLLDGDRVAAVRARLEGAPDVVGALALLVAWPAGDRAALVAQVVAAARRALAADGPPGAPLDGDATAALEWVVRLADQHGADPLVLGPVLLRLHRLAPGRSLYVPAGVPHAYLTGVGVEIMASSDNVVRAGLTTKHVDTAALLDLLDPAAEPLVDLEPAVLGPHERAHRPPVADFQLTRVDVRGTVALSRAVQGPQVLLCMSGRVTVTCAGRSVELTPGQSAFLGADAAPAVLTGGGEVYRAAPGLAAAAGV